MIRRSRIRYGSALLLTLTLATTGPACASTQPTAARDEVADILAQRAGMSDVVVDARDAESRARVRERVADLLAKPLTVEAATAIALLNNRAMLATLEELGIAQAELVQAGLLENPTIGGDLVNSTRGNGLGGGLGLSQSLLSALLIPAKKRVARAQLQQTVLTVGYMALALVRDVKIAYAGVQAAAAYRDLQVQLAQSAEIADEFAGRLLEAGNVPLLDRELFATDLDEARLELVEAELHLTTAREELNRHLGLFGPQVSWRLGTALPEPPARESELVRAEKLGIEQRLDLSAARFNVEAMEYALKLRRRGLIPEIEVGIQARNEVGNDAGHEWVVGPSLSIELPIFDPGHADIAKLGAQLRQAQHQAQGMAIDARSQIRQHRAELTTARAQALYIRDEVLERRKVVGEQAMERYNGMLLGAFELLEIREDQIEAQRSWVDARHEYWVARAELEWAVGGKLPDPG